MIADGFRLTISEIKQGLRQELVGKTIRGHIDNSAYYLKKQAMKWADGFPKKVNGTPSGFTPTVREVYKRIVWSFRMKQGYIYSSYETLAADVGCHKDSAREAVRYLEEKGLLQCRSGKGWQKKKFKNRANQYCPNLWIFINPETGTLINPPYTSESYSWKKIEKKFRENLKNPYMVAKENKGLRGARKENVQYTEIPYTKKPANPQKTSRPCTEIPYQYNNTSGGANAAPACARAPAVSATAPVGESVEMFANLGDLCKAIGTTPKNFLAAGNGVAGQLLDTMCQDRRFCGGRPVSGPLRQDPGIYCTFVCIELIAGSGNYKEIDIGISREKKFVTNATMVYIRFIVPKAVMDKKEKEFQEMMAARNY